MSKAKIFITIIKTIGMLFRLMTLFFLYPIWLGFCMIIFFGMLGELKKEEDLPEFKDNMSEMAGFIFIAPIEFIKGDF